MGAKWFGAAVKRKEDPALLAGRGRFVDDVRLPGTLHAAFVRSPHPHAKIRAVRTSAARALPRVHLVLAFADLPEPLRRNALPLFVPSPAITELYMPYALASTETVYAGEPVAVVVADTRYLAEDGAALVEVDFEPLPGAPFRALVEPVFEDLRTVRLRFSPGISFRDDDLVRDGDDAFSFMFSLSRSLDITHDRRELHLGRGDATLLHVCETGAVGSRQDFGCMGVLIPQSELETRFVRADDAVMRHLPRRSEALQLLRAYLRSVEKNRLGASPEVREIIRRHVIDLAALAITLHGALGESTLSAVAAARKVLSPRARVP